ncbi:hypothetical protein LINPERPRIM_LOCUS4925 [Linum perenne]
MDLILILTSSFILFLLILDLLSSISHSRNMDSDLVPMDIDNAVEFFDEDFDINKERFSLSLIGLFIGLIPPTPLVVSIMRKKYEMKGSLTVIALEFGLVQLLFSEPEDKLRVLTSNPCSTNKFILSIEDWCTPAPEVVGRLIHMPFWIQLFELPREFCTSKVGLRLGSQVGQVLDSMLCKDPATEKLFVRVRVVIDATKKLKVDINAIHNRKVYPVEVKYENCYLVCFLCGFLGHDVDSCPQKEALANLPSKYSGNIRGVKVIKQLNELTMRPMDIQQDSQKQSPPTPILNKFQVPPQFVQEAVPEINQADPFIQNSFSSPQPSVQLSTEEVMGMMQYQQHNSGSSSSTKVTSQSKRFTRSQPKPKGTRFGIAEEELWDKKRARESLLEERPAKKPATANTSVEEASREWPQGAQ